MSPPIPNSPAQNQVTALVLSGGGARGAYEAGVVHYMRTRLPKEQAESTLFQVYSGTSVGAINSAFLASTAADPVFQGVRLRALWRDLTDADIYRTDAHALAGFLIKTGFFTATNFLGLYRIIERKLGAVRSFPFKGILDSTPFVHFLRRNIYWKEIHRNIQRRLIDALTVTATHMLSGRSIVFVEKHDSVAFHAGDAIPIYTEISPKHILGSAAVPVIFPLIRIDNQYYGDGSLRQNTPLNPALHVGATRALIVSLYKSPQPVESLDRALTTVGVEPTLGDISGQLLNSLFLDKLDFDLQQLQRINFVLKDVEAVFGADALERLNAYRQSLHIPGKSISSLRKIRAFVIKPSENIGAIAAHHLHRVLREQPVLSPVQRFFQKVIEGSPESENDLVSYLLFNRRYLQELIELGYGDARRAHEHLVRFFGEEGAGA
jgi:NTE family protein